MQRKTHRSGGSRTPRARVGLPTALVDWPMESTVACSVWNRRSADWLMSPRPPPGFVRDERRRSPKALVTDGSRRRSQMVAWGDWHQHLPKVVTGG